MAKLTTQTFSLEKELKKLSNKHDYWQNYSNCKDTLARRVLPDVTAAADAIDGSMLTDHGPKHIETVVAKASLLVFESKLALSTYEIYLLLLSILVHDLGNALGRKGHESNIQGVWSQVWGPLGFDQIDMVLMFEIAGAHGGTSGGSKDTIRSLRRETKWRNETVRPQMLAAILRLADEMAEDRHRANLTAIALDRVKQSAQAYHFFCAALHTFVYDAEACELQLGMGADVTHFQRKLGKNGGSTYLLGPVDKVRQPDLC